MMLPYERLTIEQVARFPRPGSVIPANHQFTPSGEALTYLFSSEGNLARGLWRYDIATGARTLLAGPPPRRQLTREEELRRERLRLREEGVTDYAFARKAARETLIVPAPSGVRVSFDGGPFVDLPATAGAIDPQVSPDGLSVAFVRGGELHVAPTSGGDAVRLTHDATDGITNGLAEFIAQEELDRDHGFWWAPDSRRIAFVRVDSRHIPNFPIVHQGLPSVDVENHRYPFAGGANAVVQLGIVDIETRSVSFLDLGLDPDIYLARVNWRPDGVLTAQVLSRDQKELALAAFLPGGPAVLLHERSEPWYNLHNDYVQLLAEAGWPALLAWLALAACLVVPRPMGSGQGAALASALQSGLLAFFVGGLFYKNLLNFYTWRLFVVLAALSVSLSRQNRDATTTGLRND